GYGAAYNYSPLDPGYRYRDMMMRTGEKTQAQALNRNPFGGPSVLQIPRAQRQPWDERLPSGQSVPEAVAQANRGTMAAGATQPGQPPLKAHHGFWDRLKSIGEGALMGMTMGGPGGAIAGAITGGVKPQVIDLARYRQQQARQQEQQYRDLELRQKKAQVEALEHPEAKEPKWETRSVNEGEYGLPEGTEIRQRWNPQTQSLEDYIDKKTGLPAVAKRTSKRSEVPHESTRVVEEGEYQGVPKGTEIRTLWDGEKYVDQTRNGKPLVAKAGGESGLTSYQQEEMRRK